MCDCYSPKCHLCDDRMPIHVGDFCTERENIEVYCPRHVGPTEHFPGGVWKWGEGEEGMRKGARWGILILDTEGLDDSYVTDEICPNGEAECIKKHPRRDQPAQGVDA